MPTTLVLRKYLLAAVIAVAAFTPVYSQGVKRLVMIKLDGVPGYFVDRFVKERDPSTGRSKLPWFEEIFYKNGTRLPNFYSRGMSLSAPAWGQIDTGQHLQLKGNVEYDRYTLRPYDYLAVIPFYTGYALNKKADMPAMEVLDELGIPILSDAFPYENKYTSPQLYQRGVNMETLGRSFLEVFPSDKRDLIDEWTLGFDFRNATVDQNERDIIGKLTKRPEVDYFDYYNGNFDHASHHNSDIRTRLNVLQEIDRAIGRIWLAIKASPRANETAMVVVSDHGFSSEAGVYSQGFNLVRLLGSVEGGGHHVVTKRRLMLDYSIKGLNPFVPLIKTASRHSYYLDGWNETYPTALLDFDGNERASLHLRNSDLNALHILFQQSARKELSPAIASAVKKAFFSIIDRHREEWRRLADELDEEVAALGRENDRRDKAAAALPTKFTPDDIDKGIDKEARRVRALAVASREEERSYTDYVRSLRNLLALDPKTFSARKLRIEDLIAPGAMGEPNTTFELQNYVVGLSQYGLTLAPNGELDMDKSFARVDYFDLLQRQTVRSNVQPEVGNRPVDLIATRIPEASITRDLPEDMRSNEDVIWLYGGHERQAFLLSRFDQDGGQSYRYVPIAGLFQDVDGTYRFQTRELSDAFPLRMFEDDRFAVPRSERGSWVNSWHTEIEWLHAAHLSDYSNAVIALNEQLDEHPLPDPAGMSPDETLIRRFRQRQRRVTEADLLIHANVHWNFDVRGFNPGGNHGSFRRVSTNSVFMLAGGAGTGIPRGLAVTEPYDSLSVLPTILAAMGRIDESNMPDAELRKKGFTRLPGRVVREAIGR